MVQEVSDILGYTNCDLELLSKMQAHGRTIYVWRHSILFRQCMKLVRLGDLCIVYGQEKDDGELHNLHVGFALNRSK